MVASPRSLGRRWVACFCGAGVATALLLGASVSALAEEVHAPPESVTMAQGSLDPKALLDAPLQDLDDKPMTLRALAVSGKVVVVLHQDRHSSEQNTAFKDRLGELRKRYADKLTVVALAEVGGYDFWPAKRYVKDALQPLRSVGGALVLCDWKGAIRKQYRIAKKQSAVFVLGSGGELRSLRQGTLTDADATSLLRLIEQLAAS
ncbi:MAG: hypothetical protein KA244_10010 [Deltaproteobacteria bacterium]|jgi:hypothetical protein|nr:hypothetical protein [Deltaproteobacteria bacterium]